MMSILFILCKLVNFVTTIIKQDDIGMAGKANF